MGSLIHSDRALVKRANTVFAPRCNWHYQLLTSGVFLIDINSGKMLKIQRSAENPTHANEWSIPGGGAKRGETAVQAAVREVGEETDFVVSGGILIPAYLREKPENNKRYLYFIAAVEGEIQPDLSYADSGYREHVKHQWCHPEEWPGKAHKRVKKALKAIGTENLYELALLSFSRQRTLATAQTYREAILAIAS